MTPVTEARVVELLEQILAELQRERDPVPGLLLGATELAAELGVSARTLRRMKEEEGFPKPIRINNSVRWRRADVDRYLRARRT